MSLFRIAGLMEAASDRLVNSGQSRRRALSRSSVLPLAISIALASACMSEKPMDPAVLAMLGADDGSQVSILYGSEIMGSLEGCGCMGNPRLGGFPYRMALYRTLAQAAPGTAILQLDAGFTSSLITSQQGSVSTDAEAAMETTLLALTEAGFGAVNLTANDILAARKYFAAASPDGRFRDLLVSANLEPLSSEYLAPKPFVVRQLTDAGGRGIARVAISGVSEFPGRLDPSSGFRVAEPRQALERVIGEARQQADIVVVMAYMPAASASALVEGLEEKPDVVIVASSFGAGTADGEVMGSGLEPRLDGPTKVVYSWYKTQKLGLLRLKLDDATHVVAATNTYVKLDAPIVPDEEGERMVKRQKEAVRAAREARFRSEGVQASNSAP